MNDLAKAICDDPVAVLHNTSAAADKLVAAGATAVPALADLLRRGWSSTAHPVDVIEAIGYVLERIALREEAAVRALLTDKS